MKSKNMKTKFSMFLAFGLLIICNPHQVSADTIPDIVYDSLVLSLNGLSIEQEEDSIIQNRLRIYLHMSEKRSNFAPRNEK